MLPDGAVHAGDDREDVVDVPVVGGYSVYSDTRMHSINAPRVMVGAIVAFDHSVDHQLDTGAEDFWFGDPDRPTVLSRFELRVPPGWHWEVVAHRTEGSDVLPVVERKDRANGVIMTVADMKPLPRERHRPVVRDIMPSVWVRWWDGKGERGYEDWNVVGRWYHDLADPVLEDLGAAEALGAKLRPAEKAGFLGSLVAAFDFVARSVRYVSIQIGIGGYKPYSPAFVCKNRFGDCKDKSFLMRSLVGAWGTKSYPVLVRTQRLGALDPEVPTPGQFNHCIAAIVLPEGIGTELWATAEIDGVGRVVFLDTTASSSSPWDLPEMDQGTTALLVRPNGATLVTLPVQPADSANVSRRLEATIDAQATLLSGTLIETWSGQQAARIRAYEELKQTEQRQRDMVRELQGRFPGASVKQYQIDGLDEPLGPIRAQTSIEGGRFGRRVSNLLILQPGELGYGLVGGLAPPPRRWPLQLGMPRSETLEAMIEIPEGWVPEELPDPREFISEDLEARAEWSFAQGRLTYTRHASLLSAEISPDRYESFRDLIGRLNGADSEGVVFVPIGANCWRFRHNHD
ncbi:MAG: DUF3857 domain-containing protein, partial [Acidobacteriota bacterium]